MILGGKKPVFYQINNTVSFVKPFLISGLTSAMYQITVILVN